MKPRTCSLFNQHSSSLGLLIRCQYDLVKDLLVDMDNSFNKVFLSFVPLHPEFSPSHRVIDIFPSHFSFYSFSEQKDNSFKKHIQQLDNLAIKSPSIPLYALIIIDTNIKNNVTTFISYTHIHNKPITKTLYNAVNITSTEAELFAIKCGTISHNVVLKIIIVTDSIHATKKIFNPTITNFIQLVSPQPVDRFLQTKLCLKVLNKSFLYKSNNKQLRYQVISSCKSFVC